MTKPYITTQPELVKRMAAEGHLVGNHTATHPSLPKITDDQIKKELETTEAAFTAATGKEMERMVRPPEGAFSEKTLASLQEMGYRAVFWSMAFRDWDVKKQPGADKAYENVINNIHPGAVILLHAVSSSNAEALNDIIYELKGRAMNLPCSLNSSMTEAVISGLEADKVVVTAPHVLFYYMSQALSKNL